MRMAKSTYAISILHENVVVTTDCNQEKNYLHIVEDMDPLLSF